MFGRYGQMGHIEFLALRTFSFVFLLCNRLENFIFVVDITWCVVFGVVVRMLLSAAKHAIK